MTRTFLFLAAGWCLMSCVHKVIEVQRPLPQQPIVRSDLALWIDYANDLEAFSPKELKNEWDRLKRLKDPSWEDELRLALAASMLSLKSHSYQKAAEILSQATSRIQGNSDLKAWLRLYTQQITSLVQLDKELVEERRQRSELEKKLKALSDIERDISERSKNADIARP